MPGGTRGSYLHSGLGEVDPAGQVLSDEGVGVVCSLKHPLQSLELAAVEGGPVPALLPLLLLFRVHLFVCREKKKKVMFEPLRDLMGAQVSQRLC